MKVLGYGDRGCVIKENDTSDMVTKVIPRQDDFEREKNNAKLLYDFQVDPDHEYLIYPDYNDPNSIVELDLKNHDENTKKLERECKNLKVTMQHFNTSKVYMLRMKDGGVSLDRLIEDINNGKPIQRLSFDEAVGVLRNLFTGLERLHNVQTTSKKYGSPVKSNFHGLAHGDVYPKNVTIQGMDKSIKHRKLRAYIIDFGEDISGRNKPRDYEAMFTSVFDGVIAISDDIARKKLDAVRAHMKKTSKVTSSTVLSKMYAAFNKAVDGVPANQETPPFRSLRTRQLFGSPSNKSRSGTPASANMSPFVLAPSTKKMLDDKKDDDFLYRIPSTEKPKTKRKRSPHSADTTGVAKMLFNS